MRAATLRRVAVVAAMTAACTPAVAAAKPDLVVRSFEVAPETIAAGRTVTLTDVVLDEGRGRARATSTGYTLLDHWARLRLGVRSVPALKSGETSRGSATLTVPATTRDGSYRLVACADARGDVRESSERNNCRLARRRLVIDSVAPVAPKGVSVRTRRPGARPRGSRSLLLSAM